MDEPMAGARPLPGGDRRSISSVGRGTSIMVVGTALLFVSTLLSRVLLARSVSGADWGEFSLGIAIIGLASVVALLGLDQATARMLSYERDPAARRAIAVKGIALAIATATIASTALFLLAPALAALFRTPDYLWLLRLFSVALGFTILSLMLAALFQGMEDALPNAAFNQILSPGLFLAFVGLAVVLHLGFGAVIVGYVLANGLAVGAFAVYAVRTLPHRVPAVPGPLPKVPQLWTFAAALWGVGSLYYVTAFADTLILGVFRSAVVVGIYSAGINLSRVLLVGNNALTFIYLPVAARLARDRDLGTVRSTYQVGTRWIVLLTLPATLVFCLLPGPTLEAIYGVGFGSGAEALQVLSAAAFVSILIGPANASLAGIGETRWLLASTVLSGVVNITLSVSMIPTYGLLGAAIAWSVARVVYPSVAAVRLQTKYRIHAWHASLWRPLLFTLLAAGGLDALVALHGAPAWSVFPLYLVGVGIYGIGLVATRSLLPQDAIAARSVTGMVRRVLPRTAGLIDRGIDRIVPSAAPRP